MQQFPSQVRDLGKEIAAFATSGGGVILIGVDDVGRLIGLAHMDQVSERDNYLRRIQGIAHGTVAPPITPHVGFACEGSTTVLFIRVQEGNQPVYYCEGRPYIRHLTESRPAKPEEVVARVMQYASARTASEPSQEGCRRKPDVEVAIGNAIIGTARGVSPPVIMLTARNHDRQAVVLNSFGIDVPEIGQVITGIAGFGAFQSNVRFPYELGPGRKCEVWIAERELAEAIATRGQSGKVRLVGFYTDELANSYTSPSQDFDVARGIDKS